MPPAQRPPEGANLLLEGCAPASVASGREALLFLGFWRRFAGCLAREAGERCLPEAAIEGVGGLFESGTVEQTLDVARDRIRGHVERSVERINVLARDRTLRVTNQGRDRDLGEPEVVRDACEAVAIMSS